MLLKETNHEYYCSDSNYYVGNRNGENHGLVEYDSWSDFISQHYHDMDLNFLIRYDIKKNGDKYTLHLYFILQRKGIFAPVIIDKITEEDMDDIEDYLLCRWNYIKKMWEELSNCK